MRKSVFYDRCRAVEQEEQPVTAEQPEPGNQA